MVVARRCADPDALADRPKDSYKKWAADPKNKLN